MMGGGAAEEVRYTAFLLDEDSRLALLRWASEVDSSLALPPDWTTRADHLTIWHRPTPERMAGYDLCGFRCELRVLGLAKDHRALAVHVEVPDFVPTPDAEVRAPRPFVPRETKTIELTRPDGPRAHPSPRAQTPNQVHHVTVAHAPAERAVVSAETLAVAMRTGTYLETQSWKPLVLMGRLGWVDASSAHRFEWTNAAASAPASAPESPPRWLDDDDPFAAAAAAAAAGRGRGGGGGAGPSAASPYERGEKFPEFQEFQEFPRQDSATSTSFFSNEGIGGDFGTFTARAGPPASDEPAEDVKFSRVADLVRDFSERVCALGLNNDVYLLALRTCGWDIYDAHEWLDRMLRDEERRAAEAAAGVALEKRAAASTTEQTASSTTRVRSRATSGRDRPAGTLPGRRRRVERVGRVFRLPHLDRRDREADGRGGFEPPRAPLRFTRRRTLSGRGGRAGPRRTGSSCETCRTRSRTSTRASWRTRCTAPRLRGTWTGRRRGSTRSTPRGGTRCDSTTAAAAAAAAAEGTSQNGDGGEGGESRPRESKAIDITRERCWQKPGGPAALSWAARERLGGRSWKP